MTVNLFRPTLSQSLHPSSSGPFLFMSPASFPLSLSSPLQSCSVLWRQLLETGAVSMTCIRIVQRSQAKKLAAYARKMVDYIVFTCPSPSSNSAQFNQVCSVVT